MSVSRFYPCRGSADQYRVYVEIEYYDCIGAEHSDGKRARETDLRTINDAHVSAK